MVLASPLTPSGPLSECPAANLNHFLLQTTEAFTEERLRFSLSGLCIEYLYKWCPPETKHRVGFHDYECAFSNMITPWGSPDGQGPPPPTRSHTA